MSKEEVTRAVRNEAAATAARLVLGLSQRLIEDSVRRSRRLEIR